MKVVLAAISTFCFLTVSAQYKQFAVGGSFSTNRFYTRKTSEHPTYSGNPTRFSSGGLLLQWNSRYVFSVAVNPSYERTTRFYVEDDYKYDANLGIYAAVPQERVYRADRILLPVIIKATIGKRINFTPFIGVNYSVLLPSSYCHQTEYTKTEDGNLTDPHNQMNFDADMSDKIEWNAFLGGGLVFPLKEQFLLSLDARIPVLKLSFPKSEDRNEYMSYNKPAISISFAYQFNFKKESSYKFTTFYYRLAMTSAEK